MSHRARSVPRRVGLRPDAIRTGTPEVDSTSRPARGSVDVSTDWPKHRHVSPSSPPPATRAVTLVLPKSATLACASHGWSTRVLSPMRDPRAGGRFSSTSATFDFQRAPRSLDSARVPLRDPASSRLTLPPTRLGRARSQSRGARRRRTSRRTSSDAVIWRHRASREPQTPVLSRASATPLGAAYEPGRDFVGRGAGREMRSRTLHVVSPAEARDTEISARRNTPMPRRAGDRSAFHLRNHVRANQGARGRVESTCSQMGTRAPTMGCRVVSRRGFAR